MNAPTNLPQFHYESPKADDGWTQRLFDPLRVVDTISIAVIRKNIQTDPILAERYLDQLLQLQDVRRQSYAAMAQAGRTKKSFPNDDDAHLKYAMAESAVFRNPFSAAMYIQALIATQMGFWRRVVEAEEEGLGEGDLSEGLRERFGGLVTRVMHGSGEGGVEERWMEGLRVCVERVDVIGEEVENEGEEGASVDEIIGMVEEVAEVAGGGGGGRLRKRI